MKNSRAIVITGSTGGIGAEIAQYLAKDGCSLVLVNRSSEKTAAQLRDLRAVYSELDFSAVLADLMDTSDIERAVAEITQSHERIDALYNISGVLTSDRILSAQSFESHFAVNVLANYALIKGLHPLLLRPPHETPSMVVNMSSSAISVPKELNVAQLPDPEEIGGLMGAYAKTKLALTAMSAAMAETLGEDGILIRAIDPGATLTPMTTKQDGMPLFLRWLAPVFFSKPDKQAIKIVAAADPTAFQGHTGILVSNDKEKALPKIAADRLIQGLLMDLLESSLS